MSVPATCPYCNALLAARVSPTGGRVECERCGEVLGSFHATGGASAVPEPVKSSGRTGHHRWRLVAVVVAGIGLWAVSANWHRIRSPFGPATPPAKPVVVQPAELPGLGYLPESTEAVLAVQVPFLLERLGPDAQKEPAHALTSLGLPESVVEILDKASAVGLKNVDQLVVGLGFERHSLPPQIVIVVHARQPFDLNYIAKQAKAHALKREHRTMFVTKAGPLPEVYWWQAADRVLVATISQKDFDDVPGQPRAGIDHLRPTLQSLIRDQVADDAFAWFAATSDKWDQYLRPYTLPLMPLFGRNDLINPAERLRTVAISVPHDPDRAATVRIGVKSADSGADLRATLSEKFAGEHVEVTGDQEWCRLQLPNDPTRIGSIVSRLTANSK